MKKIEVIAVVLIILKVLTLFPSPVTGAIVSRLYGPDFVMQLSWAQKGIVSAQNVVSLLVHFGVSVWLFIQARRDKASPWVWGLLGLTFSISAAILYFLLQLIEKMKTQKSMYLFRPEEIPPSPAT